MIHPHQVSAVNVQKRSHGECKVLLLELMESCSRQNKTNPMKKPIFLSSSGCEACPVPFRVSRQWVERAASIERRCQERKDGDNDYLGRSHG
jgi:hypothetical protein